MKNISEIEYNGKKLKLVFNLNVMEEIQEEFGSVDNWGKLTDGASGEVNIKALKFGFTAMINEAIDIENDENGTDIPFLATECFTFLSLGMVDNQLVVSVSQVKNMVLTAQNHIQFLVLNEDSCVQFHHFAFRLSIKLAKSVRCQCI